MSEGPLNLGKELVAQSCDVQDLRRRYAGSDALKIRQEPIFSLRSRSTELRFRCLASMSRLFARLTHNNATPSISWRPCGRSESVGKI